MKTILKRDGRVEPFDKSKITIAVLKAFYSIDGEYSVYARDKAEKIAEYVESELDKEQLSVEQIQDLVEKGLMSTKRKDVAKAYILYREKRSKIREKNSKIVKEIGDRLFATDVQNQNANLDEMSFGGRKGEAANALLKQYALDYCMSPKSKKHHLENRIYIHDLDSYAIGMHNCMTIPFDDLLEKGFTTRQTDVRPANSISTAFQLVAVIFQLQSLQQFGGVSAGHLDWTMVPYVRRSFYKHYSDGMRYIEHREPDYEFTPDSPIDWKDYKIASPEVYAYAMDMTKRECAQAVEALYHNLNTLQSRSGNQLPFTSINYGTCTLAEGRMVTETLLNGSLKGTGKHHRTPIFPCGIFQVKSGVNKEPDTPNYDLYRLALKSTSLRLYPNYGNCDWSGNAGYDPDDPRTFFSTMGCRTANGFDINGLKQQKDGRGNICPVTIILPTVAMEAKDLLESLDKKHDIKEIFLKHLDDIIHEAKDMLIERFDYICKQPAESASFMYDNNVIAGYDPEEGIISALKHGTLSLGQLGLAECLQILIGQNQTTKEGMDLAKEIESLFKQRCAEFKQKYKLNFGVYYSPAENLCYTSMKKFKETYGIIDKVSDKDYFTNSTHIPVWEKMTPFKKIDLESELSGYSSAGCITYVEMDGGMEKNIDGLEKLVNYAMDKDIPYFAINIPNDTCLDCGFIGEFNNKCPECGSSNIQQLRRVTGYLTGDYTTAFNKGKIAETDDRFRHSSLWEV